MDKIVVEINEMTARLAALLEQRNAAIVAAVGNGESLASVGRRYGLTRQRVMVIAKHFATIDEWERRRVSQEASDAAGVGDEN